jgi:hypothetical protein
MRNRYNLLNLGKNSLIFGMILTALLFGEKKAKAEDSFSKPKLEERILNKKNKKQNIDLIFDYSIKKFPSEVSSLESYTYFDRKEEFLLRTSNSPKINNFEKNQIESILSNIKNKNISSYSEFINQIENFSENQKLVLLSSIGGLSNELYEKSNKKVDSQEDFFSKLQTYLNKGEKNGLGVCRHISSNLEQLANDARIRTSAVSGASSGNGHVYTIMKGKNGTAVIDYGTIFLTDTKNIEKTLDAYQKDKGTTVFDHTFFENNKFKYRLITKEGKNFLDFIDHDETSDSLKNLLLHDTEEIKNKIIFENGNYSNSAELNILGFFMKTGKIKGNSSSPLKSLKLFQGGYKRKLNIEIPIIGNLAIDGNISFVNGNLFQDFRIKDNNLKGYNFDLGVSLDKEEGFKAGFRGISNRFETAEDVLFEDNKIEAGISYEKSTKSKNIEPYLIFNFSSIPNDIGTKKYELELEELRIGALFDFNSFDNLRVLFEPYYSKKNLEKEIGANIELKSKSLGLKLGSYTTNSDYVFCPDKNGFYIGIYKNLNNWKMWMKYKRENLDYDSEIEKEKEFNFGASLRF